MIGWLNTMVSRRWMQVGDWSRGFKIRAVGEFSEWPRFCRNSQGLPNESGHGGNWIYETLLGRQLPRPPADVPQLPEGLPQGLSARQMIEAHSAMPACAKCHERIDPLGFALENFDAVGRLRKQQVDARSVLPDGNKVEGIAGLRDYLMTQRREEVVEQFNRKLLGYALGRSTQLSDQPCSIPFLHRSNVPGTIGTMR